MERLDRLLERLDYNIVQGNTQIEITEVIYDSRKVSPGCLFVCIKGAAVDGHTFAAEAVEKGFSSSLVELLGSLK